MKANLRVLPLLVAISAGAAHGGVNIKIDDDNFFTNGAQIQPAIALSFDGTCTGVAGSCTGNEAPSGNFGFNSYLRRVRLLAGGQIGKQVTFAIGTDMPNLGSKADFTQQFLTFEAYVSYQFIDNQYQIGRASCRERV